MGFNNSINPENSTQILPFQPEKQPSKLPIDIGKDNAYWASTQVELGVIYGKRLYAFYLQEFDNHTSNMTVSVRTVRAFWFWRLGTVSEIQFIFQEA